MISSALALIFTLLHVVFDIKLRDSTGQVKVHKIKEKKETSKNGKERAGNERPVIVDVKPVSFTPHPYLFPPTDQNSDADAAHPCWWGPEGPSCHTVREMKLLYLWMFLLRISEHGPSTRSKRGLSSFTHLSGPRATTVAALGRFNSRAISPGGRKRKRRQRARERQLAGMSVSFEHLKKIDLCLND